MTVDFNDYFWGDKNNGFDVLYHNMKYGLVASKELSDFFREKSNIEEHNSKLMTKLANKAGSGCVNGTFAPIWVVLKSSADRLASLHLQMVQKISELVKDVAKYADELHKKHKTVKEEESSTLEVVQAMQSSTVAVQKSKDLYNSKMLEFEKLKKDNASTKDLEKAETKLKKQQDDYKALLEKHNPVKMEFERRMNITCKKFQDIEDSHLKQMKEFLSTYIELLQNNHDMVGQVHSEFKRQFLEMTVDKLLEQFVLSKYTGLEKPVSAILRSGRNKAKVKKANKKKKDGVETSSTKDEKTSVAEEVTEENKVEETPVVSLKSSTPLAPTATPDVDEDGYSIQPKEPQWETVASKKEIFYSDSDSDSEHDEQERKIRVEIKPLNNGIAPISASVDELRATVESLSLSPLGGALSQHQSPGASNASTPTASHPYAPLQSPTLSVSNTSRYADLGDIFSEVGEISASAPASANLSKSGRQIPTPTSANSIAIPRPPSRREAAVRGRVSPSTISRADSVGSLEFRTASIGIGSSRGPSPLTIGMSDTVPLAVAFHEIVHAYFKGSDESRCQVKMSGDMMLSFPAGIVSVLANNPNPAKLGFRIKNTQNLENVLPNKQLVTIDQLQSTSLSTVLEFNMPALTSLLRRQSEQNPTASYFNVDILKYQVKSKSGALSCPFQLVCYWKCEPTHTDIKIDYKYNSHAMAAPSPLLNVSISVPVDGGVKNVQSKPFSAWLGESNRLVWNFTDISQHSDNNGVGTLRARLDVANGPSNPSMLTTQFNCEGTTLSGIEFELVGAGYRLSLVKRRFVSGKYICEGDGIRNMTTPTPPSSSSPSPYNRTG
ncbi:F-BAR domain only protein 2 isoform X12 [Bradysia coprophila]|uniref:F-BAR domain only protein 2 isoform X12 n=1 Tax=Bradysia coprophila TaxID=38358 RepID=UPI00187DBE31|nr:F-BAR domain only protein 2 isoform X12 [Bradysia coprophila]XP_037040948.1 F-BAR domain only protein 2 isoform X12 [Bradysia coprophila]XP_037040949.1 F-BAR domain only protein 2 isoform X12 [Bradysia coprophila]